MKMRIIISILIVCLGILISYNLYNDFYKENTILENKNVQNATGLPLVLMLETDIDTNVYEVWNSDDWPGTGYIFNKEKSKCENGGTLEWTGSSVLLKTNTSDKCYAYFDKKTAMLLSDYLINQVGEVADNIPSDEYVDYYTGELIYHNGNIKSTVVNQATNVQIGDILDANDNAYRYSGSNPNNFICFGPGAEVYYNGENCPIDNLYRIIGIFPFDDNNRQLTSNALATKYLVKLIKSEYITEEQLRGKKTENKRGDADKDSFWVLNPLQTVEYTLRIKNKTDINGFFWNTLEFNSWDVETSDGKYNLWKYNNQEATLNQDLNNENTGYLHYMNSNTKGINWLGKIENVFWNIGGATMTEVSTPATAFKYETNIAKTTGQFDISITSSQNRIGLLYLSDYGFAAKNVNNLWAKKMMVGYDSNDNRQNNWLFNGINEWTIVRDSDKSNYGWRLDMAGWVGNFYVQDKANGVRPVFYLKSNVELIDGDGTAKAPYKINL